MIQYSLMHFYGNIHTSHARHTPVTIKTKDILLGTCLTELLFLAVCISLMEVEKEDVYMCTLVELLNCNWLYYLLLIMHPRPPWMHIGIDS